MSIDWNNIFDNYGIKTVTRTDKNKGAYVPNRRQRTAIEAANVQPATIRPAPDFRIAIIFDSGVNSVNASYYYSERSAEAGRSPEPRMGHEFISTWLQQGDTVIIGNVGSQIFAAKLAAAPAATDNVTKEVVQRADSRNIFARAMRAKGKPVTRVVERQEYVRNPWVVQAAILRSEGKCEMLSCTRPLFERDDGTPYMEVHHIVPLAEGGDDTLINTAALCPSCHRELHSGKGREKLRDELAAHIEERTR